MLLAAVVGVTTPARTDPRDDAVEASGAIAHHPMLRASLARLEAGSRLWRDALESLTHSGRRALVLTPDQVRYRSQAKLGDTQTFDPDVLAEASPVVVSGTRVPTVVVVVNLPLLSRAHHTQPWSLPIDLERDLDRILIHEVYGHAFPYLLAGDLSGRCADAEPGQRPADACAIQRENAVRGELGLGIRSDAGLGGLQLHRRLAHWFRAHR